MGGRIDPSEAKTIQVTVGLTWVNVEYRKPDERMGQVICLTANGRLMVMEAKTFLSKHGKYAIEWWAEPVLPE